MKSRTTLATLTLALLATACETPSSPIAQPDDVALGLTAAAAKATAIDVAGFFEQTAITSLVPQQAGGNTKISQESVGLVTGTLTGTYVDDLKVTIHSNGTFNAHFNITCQCSLGGQQGVVEFVASDRGQMTGPTTAEFAGKATIIDASGGLAGLRGVLRIEGHVDLTTGLAKYSYAGTLH